MHTPGIERRQRDRDENTLCAYYCAKSFLEDSVGLEVSDQLPVGVS